MSPSDDDTVFSNEEGGGVQPDLRQRISAALLNRIDTITADTVEIFPFSGTETLDDDYCRNVGKLLVDLLAFSVRDARLDPTGPFVANLHRIVLERRLSTERLFTFAYLIERTVLDELALDEVIGVMTESWPVVAQLVSRGSFDVLAAYPERALLEPAENCLVDPLTTLYSRPMLGQCSQGGRTRRTLQALAHPVRRRSIVDHQRRTRVRGRRQILERLGILIGKYFRHYDWVARYSDDSIAVLLTHADADHASDLAERARHTVEERLGFVDHRTDEPVVVTLSVAVINVKVGVGDLIDPDRLMADAEALVDRAKRAGRNRVERVDGYSGAHQTRAPI
jgi:hypothetical protein